MSTGTVASQDLDGSTELAWMNLEIKILLENLWYIYFIMSKGFVLQMDFFSATNIINDL